MDETELVHASVASVVRAGRRPTHGRWRFLLVVPLLIAVKWSIDGTGFDVGQLVSGSQTDYVRTFTGLLLHPNLSSDFLAACVVGVLQTLQIAILGIVFGAIMAFPLAILATRGLLGAGGESTGWRYGLGGRVLYVGARTILSFWRAMPALIWALFFIAIVGLGAFPAVLALSIHSAGLLGKLYAEVMEAVDQRPIEALRATGAGRLQVLCYAVIPQSWSGFVSLTLYQSECNIRDSTIVGVVGAVGIGYALYENVQQFNYHEVSTLIAVTFLMVVVVDNLSALLRRGLVG